MNQKKKHRWMQAIGLLALSVAVVVLALATLLLGSLPHLDGDREVPGLAASVTIERDDLGVATITAANRTDAARALGYVPRQERYFEMDLLRRSSAGELAALVGPAAIDLDKRRRVHRMRERVRADLDAFTQGQREALEAYVEGVNAGLADLKVRPWPYLLLRQEPRPWTIEDSALAGFAMYFDLQDEANKTEFALWQAKPYLPPSLWALLTRDGTAWDAPIVGEARGDAVLPGNDEIDLRSLPHAALADARPRLPDPPILGSNNFAVSGALTATGSAIVADDMHLGLRVPNIWFRARLKYSDPLAPDGHVDATGFTLPGLPAVVVGSNGHVAWAFTNSYGDWLDWQELPACEGGAGGGDCPPVRHHRERIDVAGGEPVMFDVEETDWGPILHRAADGRRLALRWVAHLPGALTMGLADFPRARAVDDVLAIANRTAIPAQNLLVGDSRGKIAWRLLGPVPARSPGCETSPLAVPDDAALNPPDACAPWPLASSRGVSVVAPPDQRLWTANNRVVDGELLREVGDGGYALGARARQIRDDLFDGERFDEHALLATQLDDRTVFLRRWWELMRDVSASDGTPALATLAAASTQWPDRATADSVSYRLVRGWRNAVLERIAEGLTGPARAALGEAFEMPALPQLEGVAWPMVTQRPSNLLPPRFASWQALFEDAAAEVRDELAAQGPLSERTWGERNTADICHPLARAVPAFLRPMLCMPAEPLPGDSNMPRVQAPDMGASERMVVSPGHESDGITHMPGGQSGHLMSPFWGAGHDDWVHGRPTPFLPGKTTHWLKLAPQ